MTTAKRGNYTNNLADEAEHARRVEQLGSPVRELAVVLQTEADHEFGASFRYHRKLPREPGRAFSDPFVFGTMIAIPKHDAFEVRVHLSDKRPQPDISCPVGKRSIGGRNRAWVYPYRPERLRHLIELIELLHQARRDARSAA